MPATLAQYVLGKFDGLNEQKIIGQAGDSSTTRMRNAFPNYGRLIGRNGMTLLGSPMASSVIGFKDFILNWLDTILVRGSINQVERYTGGTWTSILSAPLTNTFDIITFEVFQNKLYFTNGTDPLMVWDGSASPATPVAAAPLGSFLRQYANFLMIGRLDATSAPYRIRFSADGTTWNVLDELNFQETQGSIRGMDVLGDALYVYKGSSIIRLRFVGGATRFTQEVMPTDKGLLRYRTLAAIDKLGHIFMSPDQRLYLNNGSIVRHISAPVDETLQAITNTQARQAFATSDFQLGVYWIVIPQPDDKENCIRLGYNWKSNEWIYHTYEPTFTAGLGFQPNVGGAASGNTLVFGDNQGNTYTMDSGFSDNGRRIYMDYETDWQMFAGPSQKYIEEVKMIWDNPVEGLNDLEAYISTDFFPSWFQMKVQSIEGTNVPYGGGSRYHAFVNYKIMPPLLGRMFNIRLRIPVR